jgi:hypothetical protein
VDVDFADFAVTASIFDSVFVESLHLGKGAGEATRRLVEEIVARKHRPLNVKDIMKELKISKDQAYSKLRYEQTRKEQSQAFPAGSPATLYSGP